ncbi:hypothetical protein D9M68_617930 [compost metagenome]
MADALFGLRAHPRAVAAHVFGQSLRTRPVFAQLALLVTRQARPHRRATGEARRDFDHGLVDGDGHRVEVAGVAFQPKALRFQRQRAAARKGVVKGGQLVGVEKFSGLRVALVQFADLSPRAADFSAGALQHLLVVGVLPPHKVFDDLEQSLALGLCLFLVDAVAEAAALLVAGVVDHLREDHGPRRCQRTPRPPQVQRAGVAVADGFLSRSSDIDGIERQGDFDELL